METYETILWASDGSDGATSALAEALRLAELNGAHLIAVHCDQHFGGRSGNWSLLADEEDVRARIWEQVAELKADGVDVEFVARHSHEEAADVVAGVAIARGADLIVCGTRGLGAIGRFFLGSFTTRLLHVAPCPVLAVPERTAVTPEREADEVEARA